VSVKRGTAGRPGTVLIAAMWIALVLAGLVLVFGRSMRVAALSAANRRAAMEAEWIARGALAFLLAETDGTDGTTEPGVDIAMEAVEVGAGYFWLLRPNPEDDAVPAFGIRDEAGKINVNEADVGMLAMLPGMTDELAAAVADWRDPDGAGDGGAGSEHYLLLAPPYLCKSGPLETVEELLLLKGATMAILFGEDANRNGLLDANENDGDDGRPSDNRDGRLDRGVWDFVTTCTSEANTPAAADAVDVNSTGTTRLSSLLQEVVSSERLFTVVTQVRSNRPYASVLDFYARSGLTAAEFARIAGQLTVGDRARQAGLVNLRTAPKQALLCLPGMEETDADALIAKRTKSSAADLSTLAWVAEALPAQKAGAIGGWVTLRSFQYSADIVALSGDGRAFKRFRAVVDARSSPPRVLSWQDLTGLGWPLPREIIDAVRRGEKPPPVGGLTFSGGA